MRDHWVQRREPAIGVKEETNLSVIEKYCV
jgi:hypothetical protein